MQARRPVLLYRSAAVSRNPHHREASASPKDYDSDQNSMHGATHGLLLARENPVLLDVRLFVLIADTAGFVSSLFIYAPVYPEQEIIDHVIVSARKG